MRQNTKAALIRAAERLFAEQGLGTVSVRDITRAAGARNESALHYHFGGIEALIREIFAQRYHAIEAARVARIAELDATQKSDDIGALLEAAMAPLFEACVEENGRLYAYFLVQLVTDPRFNLTDLVQDFEPGCVVTIKDRVCAVLTHVPEDSLIRRLRHVFTLSIILTADYARQIDAGTAAPPEQAVREAATCLHGFLQGATP
ncbi:MAG: TetR/AcrR family transcriptional regulator [Alphaproteobacteria bacterium]